MTESGLTDPEGSIRKYASQRDAALFAMNERTRGGVSFAATLVSGGESGQGNDL
jgi:hypothetical protein